MAVQKSRVTRSKRNMRRLHDRLVNPTLSIDQTTGETHRRHHITPDGFYRGKHILDIKQKQQDIDEEESE